MKQFVRVLAGVGGLAAIGLILSVASGADEKELTIKEIMKKGHNTGKPPLCGKVASGKASKEEKQDLLSLYTALAKQKPPEGTAESWKEKTDALVKAAKACVDDDKDGPSALKKAVACKACHEVHKGKK